MIPRTGTKPKTETREGWLNASLKTSPGGLRGAEELITAAGKTAPNTRALKSGSQEPVCQKLKV